jgi:hypothetical protein
MGIRTQVTRVKEQGCYHWATIAIVDEHGLRDKLKQKRAELGPWWRLVDELGDDGDMTNQDGRDGVGGAARRGEGDGGGAESRGSPESRR